MITDGGLLFYAPLRLSRFVFQGTTENSSEMHTETFVLCVFALLFSNLTQGRKGERDAKGVVNLCRHVLRCYTSDWHYKIF